MGQYSNLGQAITSLLVILLLPWMGAGLAYGAEVTIVSWSSTGGKPANKESPQDLIYSVQPGDVITFSAASETRDFAWSVSRASKVLQTHTESDKKNSTFTWTVPQEKGSWDIQVSVTPYYQDNAQLGWTLTTSALSTVRPGESIQKAIDALPPEGGVVELAEGTFVLPQGGELPFITDAKKTLKFGYAVLINKGNVNLRGAGMDKTKIISPGEDLPPYHMIIVGERPNVSISNMFITSGIPAGRGIPKFSPHAPREQARQKEDGHGIHFWAGARDVRVAQVRIERLCDPVQAGGGPVPTTEIVIDSCIFRHNRIGVDFHRGVNRSRVVRTEIAHHGYWGVSLHISCSDNRIERCTLHHNYWAGIGLDNGCNRNLIKDNICWENTGPHGREGGAGILVWRGTATDTTIVGNVLWGNKGDGLRIQEEGSVANTLAANNLIYGNQRHGVAIFNREKGEAAAPKSPYNITVRSNTIFSNKEDGIRQEIKNCRVTLANNIITDNAGCGANRADSEMLLSYNNVWNNKGGDYQGCAAGANSLSEDPLFADHANGDFHLKSKAGRWDPKAKAWVKDDAHSPCIDAGDPKSDSSNEPAPNGGRINMGAYGNTTQASKSVK